MMTNETKEYEYDLADRIDSAEYKLLTTSQRVIMSMAMDDIRDGVANRETPEIVLTRCMRAYRRLDALIQESKDARLELVDLYDQVK